MDRCFFKGKKCVLWGLKRHIYEFAYLFDCLDYYGYIAVNENGQYNVSLKELTMEDVRSCDKKDLLLVICDFCLKKYEVVLQEYGLEKMKRVLFEDCFELLDPFNASVLACRKIAVWGTGDTEKNLREAWKSNHYDINVDLYIDGNAKKPVSHQGRPVSTFSELEDVKGYFIIVASIFYREIKMQLDESGLREGLDYLPFSAFMSKPSAMFRELVHTEERAEFYCNRPYTWLYYAWFGAYPCCSTWVKYPIGNPAAETPEECWNSVTAKLYRLSVDTRTYCFCKKEACGIMGNLVSQDTELPIYNKVPKNMVLGLDDTCNLHCASCREHVQVTTGKHLEIRERFAEDVIASGWLEEADELELSGSGEALFSKIDRRILFSNETCKRNSISLLSNGILLTEDNLNDLKKHFERIALKISIDAATEKTYQKLRRGGNWEVLLKNLKLISELRQRNEISYVEIKMVVQKSNYREMVDFVRMGKEYCVDRVVFTKLLNWDMYSEEQYLEEAMLNRDGSLRAELLQMLQKEEMRDEAVRILEFSPYL